MGTWGHGNLDSDMAIDELSRISNNLVEQLLSRAKRKESREYDEDDYTLLFVEFEILFALDARNLFQPSKLPTPDEIDYLRADFIDEWEPYFRSAVQRSRDVTARKRRIVSTFNKLRKITEKFQHT